MKKILLISLVITAVISCNHGMARMQSNVFIKLLEDGQNEISDPVAKPVQVDLYYESLCPGCRFFFETQLFPTFYKFKGLGVLNVGLYPYGNAKEVKKPDGSWKFTCQHGKHECLGNLIEACIVQHTGKEAEKFLPIISCMESSDDPVKAARGCMKALSDMDQKQIKAVFACAKGSEGNKIMHELAEATDSLNPPHLYVPWVVMDGVHNKTVETRALSDLTSLVCDAYKGEKPRICAMK
eukprot:TRINITY_DN1549_c0_g1_i5.p1 TRINITY_DN1549_c0_g1~~TRINITY_DN1549_c0_g1_i5.p1  ORF type:complete len:239 (+),score=48.85 TRINITY_DN1549_c0_g1_i5:38-754(+)